MFREILPLIIIGIIIAAIVMNYMLVDSTIHAIQRIDSNIQNLNKTNCQNFCFINDIERDHNKPIFNITIQQCLDGCANI